MDPLVINQMTYSRESLAAVVTFVGTLTSMRTHVYNHVSLFREFLATASKLAFEPL